MIKSYVCDRCHRDFTLTNRGFGIVYIDSDNKIAGSHYDLCPECQDKLRNWFLKYNENWQQICKEHPYYKDEEEIENNDD